MKLHPTISMLSTMLLMGLHWATSAVSWPRRKTTHSKSWRSGWIHGAFCSHSITLWPGGASFSVTWARLSLLSITFNQTDYIQEVVCCTRVAKRTKCPVWDNNRDLLAWNERKTHKAGQTVNLWPLIWLAVHERWAVFTCYRCTLEHWMVY